MGKNFFAAYAGNKYQEVPAALKDSNIQWDSLEYIIEPFCGSAGFSRYVHDEIPEFKGTFIWADVDQGLIEFYKVIKNGTFPLFINSMKKLAQTIKTKEQYGTFYASLDFTTAEGWFFSHKLSNIHPGLYSETRFNAFQTYDIEKYQSLINLIQSERVILLHCKVSDIASTISKFDMRRVLVFCDPPYFQSCNSYYTQGKETLEINDTVRDQDMTTIFVDINVMLHVAPTIVVLNYSALMADYYKPFLKFTYAKTYGTTLKDGRKRSAIHMVLRSF